MSTFIGFEPLNSIKVPKIKQHPDKCIYCDKIFKDVQKSVEHWQTHKRDENRGVKLVQHTVK